jgi:hypothetical protein
MLRGDCLSRWFIYLKLFKAARFLNKVYILLGDKEVAPTRPLPGQSQAFFFKKGGGIRVVIQLSYAVIAGSAAWGTNKN